MRHFLIAVSEQEKNRGFVRSIQSAIETRGGTCRISSMQGDRIEVEPQTDCVLSIGGDGSLIRAAHLTFDSHLPLLGVNRGHLGYLCDLDESNIYEAIDRLLEGEYDIEERMMLAGGLQKESRRALNDIVISSGNGLTVVRLTIYVGDKYLYSFEGDGMIIATPTGSTAYNLSAGGPIVDPKTDVILLTPINPHTMNVRSIVLDRHDEISIELTPRRLEGEECTVSFDGVPEMTLRKGSRLKVRRSDSRARMLRLSRMNFLERMRAKLANT